MALVNVANTTRRQATIVATPSIVLARSLLREAGLEAVDRGASELVER